MDDKERAAYELRIDHLKKYMAAYNLAVDEIFGAEQADKVRELAKKKCDWMLK